MKGTARFASACAAGVLDAVAGGLLDHVSTTTFRAGERRRVRQPGADRGRPTRKRRAQVRLELATAYFGRNQMDVALEEVNSCHRGRSRTSVSLQPARAHPRQPGRGCGRPRTSFRRALAINPRDVDAMQNYGWYLCQHKRYAEGQRAVRAGAGGAAAARHRAHAARPGRLPRLRRAARGGREGAAAFVPGRPGQSVHVGQPRRGAAAPRRAGARALPHPPRQRQPELHQRADAVAGGAHRAQAGQPDRRAGAGRRSCAPASARRGRRSRSRRGQFDE